MSNSLLSGGRISDYHEKKGEEGVRRERVFLTLKNV